MKYDEDVAMMRLMWLQRVCHHVRHAPTRRTRQSPSPRAAPALTSSHSPQPASATVCKSLYFCWNSERGNKLHYF